MKLAYFLLFGLLLFLDTPLQAQELSLDYQYSNTAREHSVVNIPEDSSHLRWGIWLKAADRDFGIHTMKLFLKKDQSLFLEHFQGVAEIVLNDNQRIPITVFWFENVRPEYDSYDKVLAMEFNEDESGLLMNHELKKIVFYTSYGKFTARFANKEMVKKALYTLNYNVEIFDEVNAALSDQRFLE